jgi:hypothetical protein
MNTEPNTLTRRAALLSALKGAAAAAVAAPLMASAEAPVPVPDPEFVPENDYPFFGYEPGTVGKGILV